MRSWRLRRWLRSLLLLLLLLLLGFLLTRSIRHSDYRAGPAAEIEEPFPFVMEVAPLFDANYLPFLLHEIEFAQSSIDVSMYLAQSPRGASRTILEALGRAARRGVKIRALFEDQIESNRIWAATLVEWGADARLDDPEVKLHDKALLIDGQIFIAGSHNWSNAALRFNREASLLIRAEPEAFRGWRDRFEDAFDLGVAIEDSDAVASFSDHDATPFAVSTRPAPALERGHGRIVADGDYVKASEQIIGLMDRSFIAAIYYVSTQALIERRPLNRFFRRLVEKAETYSCEVLLDQMEISDRPLGGRDNDVTIPFLAERGIKAGYDSEETTHHVKAVVVDGRYLLLGSHNWTISSTSYNMETSILLDAPRTATLLEHYLASITRSTLSTMGTLRHSPSQMDSSSRRVPMESLIRVY